MRVLVASIAAGAFAISVTLAQAGGVADEITEAPLAMAEEPAPAGSSINPTYVVLGVLAALMIAAIAADDDEPEMVLVSDARLKTDITQIGVAENGLPLYSFRYLGSNAQFSGVMAQDVLAHTPDAVITLPGGFYAVNYEMLGLAMERLD